MALAMKTKAKQEPTIDGLQADLDEARERCEALKRDVEILSRSSVYAVTSGADNNEPLDEVEFAKLKAREPQIRGDLMIAAAELRQAQRALNEAVQAERLRKREEAAKAAGPLVVKLDKALTEAAEVVAKLRAVDGRAGTTFSTPFGLLLEDNGDSMRSQWRKAMRSGGLLPEA